MVVTLILNASEWMVIACFVVVYLTCGNVGLSFDVAYPPFVMSLQQVHLALWSVGVLREESLLCLVQVPLDSATKSTSY